MNIVQSYLIITYLYIKLFDININIQNVNILEKKKKC